MSFAYIFLVSSWLFPPRLFSENIILFFFVSLGCILLKLPISGYLLFFSCIILNLLFLFLQDKFSFYSKKVFGDDTALVTVLVGKLKQSKLLRDVKTGDILVLRKGETCFVDGTVVQGRVRVRSRSSNTISVLKKGDTVCCGSTNLAKELLVLVTTPFEDTLYSRCQNALLYSSHEKFRKYLFPFGTVLFVQFTFLFLFFFLVVYQFRVHALEYGLMILLILYFDFENLFILIEKMVLFSFYKKGIYILDPNKLLKLPKVKNLIFTKTGVLTLGTFQVTAITAKKESELLETLAYAEYYSKNRIGKCITEYCQSKVSIDPSQIEEYCEYINGVSVMVQGVKFLVGNYNFMLENGIDVEKENVVGTNLYVSRNRKYVGVITLSDHVLMPIKEEITLLKKLGLSHITTFSKDNEFITRVVSGTLGIFDCYSELTYKDRSFWIQYLKEIYRGPQAYISDEECNYGVEVKVLFAGDSSKRADIIIPGNDFSKISYLYKRSKEYLSSIHSWVLLVIFFKCFLLFLLLWIRDILVLGGILIGIFLIFSLLLFFPFIFRRKGE